MKSAIYKFIFGCSALGLGPAMQLVFRVVRFEPRNVAQEDLVQTLRGLTASFRERTAGS